MADFVLGLNAKLYFNSATYATPTWVEITLAQDVTLNGTLDEADVTTRGSAGFKETVGTLLDAGIEFKMLWKPGDAAFEKIKDAWLGRSAVEILCLDGDENVAGSEGLRASMMVTNFTRNEPLAEALTVDVTMKPTKAANPPEWFTAT